MEWQMFDNVLFEKEKAIASFNRFRRIVKLGKFFEVLVALGLISWSSACFPAVLEITCRFSDKFSTYLFNHHVAFLIGNSIIVLLFMLCRGNGGYIFGGRDFCDDYVKCSEAATPPPPSRMENATAAESVGGDDDEKHIVVRTEETKVIAQCDDAAEAIEKATKQIKRFQRTQSEKLKREIAVLPQAELRRSETENGQQPVSSVPSDTAEIEILSSEDFRRRVDAFIVKNWGKRTTKQ